MTDRILLPLKEVKRRTGLSKSTIYRRVARRQFPAPVPTTEPDPDGSTRGRVGWLSEEIEDWIAARKAAREARRKTAGERATLAGSATTAR